MMKLKKWFNDNKLSLNLNKTKFMIFGHQRTEANILLSYFIDTVSEFRFLGVIIDDKLTLKAHIAQVKSKVSKNIFVLNKAKNMFNYKTMRILYCSLILTYLSCCAAVWGNTYSTSMISLFLLQKTAVRLIHNVGYTEHTNRLFIESRLLKLDDLVKLQTFTVMFMTKCKILPEICKICLYLVLIMKIIAGNLILSTNLQEQL